MKFKGTVLIVNDMKQSVQFYRQILDLHVVMDFGSNVTLTHGIYLQTYETWKDMIHKDDNMIELENYASELYFETADIDDFVLRLRHYNVSLVHPLKEQAWGQRVVRFYDPNGHIIEVAESMKKIIKRFLSQGLTREEIAKKMNIPLDYINRIENEKAAII
ncbi:MAG: VOC family protein [Coprobacillus sp.]